jgi:hypothetical protein
MRITGNWRATLLLSTVLLSSCMAGSQATPPAGPEAATTPEDAAVQPGHAATKAEDESPKMAASEWAKQVRPVLDRRCVVCHACYDAPCQLQLTSPEGADRGATKDTVYDGGRLTAADPTRLFVDAKTTDDWRHRDFYAVLRSSDEHAAALPLMQRMLDLGRTNPVPAGQKLPESVELGLDRALTCANESEFDEYAKAHPFGGMPYGTAPLSEAEYKTLSSWLHEGAPLPDVGETTPASAEGQVRKWEAFLNEASPRQQVTSRYLYEHLFLAHLQFPEVAPGRFFRLVRSRTAPGQPVDEIATVRPYDDPGKAKFWYRLRPYTSTIVDKTHMVYDLSDAKMARYRELFLKPAWPSEKVPGYGAKDSANPFVTYAGMPARARYQFLLDDAHYFISTFIKGPVCRGQIALNVIEDRFFVAFLDPGSDLAVTDPKYLDGAKGYLKLPAENQGRLALGGIWIKYLYNWRKYVDYRSDAYRRHDPDKLGPRLADLWDGDGRNDNAMLTVLRHFDSATVVKGYVGSIPKTMWVVDYPLLERIYYDLVAGFNVYGSVIHQLSTRLYMDYLRMESEDLFLSFLPSASREKLRDSWYEGAGAETKAFLENRLSNLDIGTQVVFATSDPKAEIIHQLLQRATPAVKGEPDTINRCNTEPCRRAGATADGLKADAELRKMAGITGPWVPFTPDLSLLRVRVGKDARRDLVYTLVHDRDHFNVAFLFGEDRRLNPAADRMTIVPGFLGSYPNFFFDVRLDDLDDFVAATQAITDEAGFAAVVAKWGVRRSSPAFWATSDWLQTKLARTEPIESGILDLNRYDDY